MPYRKAIQRLAVESPVWAKTWADQALRFYYGSEETVEIFNHTNMGRYLPWLRANPNGYVVNFRWKGGKHLVVHRATAGHINRTDVDYGREGDHSGKACGTLEELQAWANKEYGRNLDDCGHCRILKP